MVLELHGTFEMTQSFVSEQNGARDILRDFASGSPLKLYCDMDGVLVNQTARDGFDTMPWMSDGKVLWEFIKPFNPSLLSQLPDETYERCKPQKVAWALRELGPDVSVFVVPKSMGKWRFALPGSVLIDDGQNTHGKAWLNAGGRFIHHVSAAKTIIQLKFMLAPA